MEHMDELQQTYFRMLKAKKQQRLARAATSGEHDAKGKERRDVTGRPGTEAVAAEYKNDAATTTTTTTTGGGGAVVDLDTFGKQLQKLVRFNGYEVIATIQDPSRGSAREGSGRGQGPRAHASLVTSIEFDKEVSSSYHYAATHLTTDICAPLLTRFVLGGRAGATFCGGGLQQANPGVRLSLSG